MDPVQVQTFMSITGASEAVARDKLQTHGGDLNAAINSYFNEGENPNPLQNQDTGRLDLMEEDEPPPRHAVPPPYAPSAPDWTSDVVGLQGFGSGLMGPRFPQQGPYVVSQPRDVREVPIDWKDDEPRARSRGGVLIEEVPDSVNAQLPSQDNSHFVVDDDEEVEAPTSSTMFRSAGDRLGSTGFNAPSISEVPARPNTEGDDIEEEMLRAAIEASQKEARTLGGGGSGIHEDDDLARAVSLSLKTAEQEKALREGKGLPESYMKGSTSEGNYSGDSRSLPNNSLPVNNPAGLDTSVSTVNRSSFNSLEETEDLEEPLLRRRSGRRVNPLLTAPSEPLNFAGQGSPPMERNGELTRDEWGGLSNEEHDEAVMLEAAMFGSLPEDSSLRYRYPSVVGGVSDATDSSDLQNLNFRRPAQPPSPTVIAQRLLREQQDDEYLASLQADREKELRAQEAADAEERLRREEEQRKQEEELLKKLAEEELERQLAAKRASLPDEPSVEDESAVNLMVRMPDGSRKCRRFRKSELLQCLFDFIDVSGGALPGTYRLVRQYPRKAFADADHSCSLNDLGLNNKYETLFLELI